VPWLKGINGDSIGILRKNKGEGKGKIGKKNSPKNFFANPLVHSITE